MHTLRHFPQESAIDCRALPAMWTGSFFVFVESADTAPSTLLRDAHWQMTLHSSPKPEYLPSQWTTVLAVVSPAANEDHQLA